MPSKESLFRLELTRFGQTGFTAAASVMEANASRYHGKTPDEIAWAEPERRTRAVETERLL
jgi:hypothetical protein